jgi:chromosome segregation ATPase
MRKLYILLILLVFAVPGYGATVYKWVDEKGVVSFTDAYKKVPPAFRNAPSLLSQKTNTETKEEVDTESYGDTLNKQLEEATLNYERVLDELLREGDRLIQYRYGGKTQYQMFTSELPSITERLKASKERMIEAKALVDKFTKETQEREDAKRRTVSSVKNGEVKTDLYGHDEMWWKEKVRPLKEQLKEAIKNYEEACDAYVKQVEALGPFKWGRLSLTQYQMTSTRLTDLSDRMAVYQGQILEVRGTLSKLSKEAVESKANPAWLE